MEVTEMEPLTLGAGVLIGYLVTKKSPQGQVQVVLVPQNGAKVPTPSLKFKTPILKLGRYSGVLAAYQLVAEWKVTAGYIGHLDEISVISDDYTNSVFWIYVAGIEAKDKVLQAPFTARWEGGLDLAPESVIQVYVHSNGAATINADAAITGREEQVT